MKLIILFKGSDYLRQVQQNLRILGIFLRVVKLKKNK